MKNIHKSSLHIPLCQCQYYSLNYMLQVQMDSYSYISDLNAFT